MFVIIVERALEAATVIGPFPHEEDADAYAAANCKWNIWRIVKLVAPESGHANSR